MDEQVAAKIKGAVDNLKDKFIKEYRDYVTQNHNNLLYKFPLIKGYNVEVAVLNDGIAILIIFIKSEQSGFIHVNFHDLSIKDPDPIEYIKKRGQKFYDEVQHYLNIPESYFNAIVFSPFNVTDTNILKMAHETANGHYEMLKQEDISKNEYFVAHDFSKEKIDDLRRAIEEAFEGKDLKPYYADSEVRGGSHILKEKIAPKIEYTRFGIFDISETKKPNVFIELGVSMGLNKPYYLIAREGTEIPTDLQGLDRIEYSSFKDLTEKLKKLIKIE